MVIVAGKTVDFHGIAGFLMGLKPDIVSIHHSCDTKSRILTVQRRQFAFV